MNFNDVAAVSVERSDYRIHFWYMSKDDAIIIMKNSDLREKSGSLQKKFSCLNIRKNEHFRTRLLEQAKQYYENNKERLQEQARNEYTELSNEEKIQRENIEEIDIKTCPKNKQKLKEYQKNYRKAKKSI